MNRFLGFASFGLSALALTVTLLGSGRGTVAPVSPSESPAAAASPRDLEALERRVKSLEDSALSLSQRLMLLEQRPVAASDGGLVAAVPPSLAAEVEQLRTEVRGMIAGEALSSEGGREYLKGMVRSVQDEMRTEQRELRQQQFQQAQAQALAGRSERLRQFVSDARLSYSQEQELTRHMDNEAAQRQALLDAVQAGGKSPQDLRREIRQLRDQTDKEVKSLLDETQQAKYDEMRREERQQSRPGGWRGRGDEK